MENYAGRFMFGGVVDCLFLAFGNNEWLGIVVAPTS